VTTFGPHLPAAGTLFDSIGGLPVHPLVVHAPVVLIPLTALGAIATACVPRWSRRFGVLLVLVGFIAVGFSFVAKESGEALLAALRLNPDDPHYAFGKWMVIVAGLLFVAVTALWLLDRGTPGNRPRSMGTKVVAVATIVMALVALAWIIKTGDTGARLLWSHTLPP